MLGPIRTVKGTPVLIGTCSWTDPTLVKEASWYPKKSMSATDRLQFYASHFPIAEADSTYYWPPSPELARGWVDRTPTGFTMNVKAYSLLTGHPTRPESLWEDLRKTVSDEHKGKKNLYAEHLDPESVEEAWRRFVYATRPLHTAGKLGAVLLQYPEWFTPKRENRAELERLPERLGGLPACVEFRSPRWLAEEDDRSRTLSMLSDLGLAYVVVDAPSASKLATVVAATTDLAVVRFHGRNNATWRRRGGGAAERFKYLYNEDELRDWQPKVEQLAESAEKVHLLMNNCYRDFGVKNAADLSALLAGDEE
jgi:uncharacterized protein YecE (DUF72 family)